MKNDHALVSVLMPVFNVQDYVAEAIESMLNQTFTDFELILLDDCSTDKTAKVISGFNDPRIVYHRNERNLGLANNLNVGLNLAKGEFIARMDGDDISLPNRLQIQIDFLKDNKDIDLCSCGLEMFGTEHQVWIRESDPEQVKVTMLFYSPVLHATSVFRKDSFIRNGLYYNQDMFPAEDYDLWSRAVFYCKLVNITEVMYRYRIHGIQVTKTDDRADERDRQIQATYLKNALPSLKKNDADMFISRYIRKSNLTIHNVLSLKSIYCAVIDANQKDHFFDSKILTQKLQRHFQNIIVYLLTENKFSFYKSLKFYSLMFELRPRQIVKLFLKRSFNPSN